MTRSRPNAMRSRAWALVAVVVLAVAAALVGAGRLRHRLDFDREAAYTHVQAQVNLGARHPGTEAAWATGEYIRHELERAGCRVWTQEFSYRGVRLRNVVGVLGEGKGPISLLGAHYDTRRLADRDVSYPTRPVPGANDGDSGVAVLLELARALDQERLANEVWLAFFDAEDQGGIDGWPWSVGASYMAANLPATPDHVIIVDMVGDADQRLTWERNSDPELLGLIWSVASDLGYGESFVPEYGHAVLDDHIPFVEAGIPAVDIIDLDYPYWHTIEDTPDKVRADSLQRVGRVLEALLERDGVAIRKGDAR